jgi:hypothetical protein
VPKGNIIVTTLNKIRPGNFPGFRGISIIDNSQDQRSRPKGVDRVIIDRSLPDPETTSYPVALAASNVPPRYPSGILSRTDPQTGRLPRYEADDDEILTRLFGVGTIYYNSERRDI